MRQAVVVIHGIGEQRPLDTIREFVKVLTNGPIRNKPDRLSESFELRRFALAETRSLPPTDVYELYWAHHMQGARWAVALRWMRKMVFRRTSKLPPGLRSLHRALWALMLLAVGATTFSAWRAFGSGGQELGTFLSSALTYTPLFVFLAQWLFGRVVLGYVGDAARYLTPDPENIEARARIRSEGVKLLRRLHRARSYSRIVVVGHSLGSVIGYDVLRHLWVEMHLPSFTKTLPQPEAESFQDSIEAVNKPAVGKSQAAAVNTYQMAQHRLWREQRSVGTPWLVTDFVTLGSPLAHAELLLEDRHVTLDQRKLERELPTCPPTSGDEDAHYGETHTVKRSAGSLPKNGQVDPPAKWFFRIPNHGAVFSVTRWSNLYFPHQWLVLGDMVGGPLAVVFGRGIRDVPVRPNKRGVWPRTLASHVLYWRDEPAAHEKNREARKEKDERTGTKEAVVALRSALQLEAKRSKEPWPEP